MRRRTSILDVVVSLAIIAASIAVVALAIQRLFPSRPSPIGESVRIPAEPIDVSNVASLGDVGATVGMIVFSDLECPFVTVQGV
jgi:hypothetical protein